MPRTTIHSRNFIKMPASRQFIWITLNSSPGVLSFQLYRSINTNLHRHFVRKMCRFLLFVGREPILVADLLTKPAHSIINQSFDCRLRVDLQRPLNGDGFGVGWYPDMPCDGCTSPCDTSNESLLASPGLKRRGSGYRGFPQITPLTSVESEDSLPIIRTTSEDQIITTTLEGRGRMGSTQLNEAELSQLSIVETRKNALRTNKSNSQLDLIKVYTAADGPCVFTSILPAWNNLNLIRLSEKIRSRLVFAHVRAASAGFPVSETNCHPWCYGRFLWMHNGYIADFPKLKRKLQASLRDELYHYVQGNTDSEWAFALFLNQLDDPLNKNYTTEQIKQALLQMIALLNQWSKEEGISKTSLFNFAVTDGKTTICSRYVNSKTGEPASLFYSCGTRFEAESEPGLYKMVKSNKREDVVIVTSEPLTFERSDWLPVPANSLIIITPKLNVLISPVMDEYHSATRKSAATWNPIFARTPKVTEATPVWG